MLSETSNLRSPKYESGQDHPTNGWLALATFGNFLSHAVCLVSVLVLFSCASRVVFGRIFADFDTELPAISQTSYALMRVTLRFWSFVFVLLVPDAIVFAFLARLSTHWRRLATVYSHSIPLATVLLLAITMLATLLPLAKLMSDLS